MSGALLPYPEKPWPIRWEDDPRVDTCPHRWEDVFVEVRPGVVEPVNRCADCHTPRCDRADDGQCIERRHHDGLHIFPGGSFDPVGGRLPDEEDR